MANANNKLAYALLDAYSKQYEQRYGKPCQMNKYRDKWAMIDLIDSVGYDRGRELITYYFKTTSSNRHSLNWFMYNFDRLDDMLTKTEADNVRRAKMREATKQMVEGQ
ncbi:MAG: hypothetical protein EBU08_03820 [Micrococcales bacterium]|jgi:hypothetical protein|nr:hypothetical protein [Micrococcales bacterium]